MKPDLSIACNKFHTACMQKLEKKEKEGYIGWNDSSLRFDLMHKLWTYCVSYVGKYKDEGEKRKVNKNDLINIANFCNFLWNLEEKEVDNKWVNGKNIGEQI